MEIHIKFNQDSLYSIFYIVVLPLVLFIHYNNINQEIVAKILLARVL